MHPSHSRAFDGAPTLVEHLFQMLGILRVVRPQAHPAISVPRPGRRGIESLGLSPLGGHLTVTVDGFSSIDLTSRFVRDVVGLVREPSGLSRDGSALHALLLVDLAATHFSAADVGLQDFRGHEVALDALPRGVLPWAWHQRAPRSSPALASSVRARS